MMGDCDERYLVELDTRGWLATLDALERVSSRDAGFALRAVRGAERVPSLADLEREFGDIDKLYGGSE